MALDGRGMTVKAVQQCVKDKRGGLGTYVYDEISSAIFAWLSFGLLSDALVVYHLESCRMPFHDALMVNCKKCTTTSIKV